MFQFLRSATRNRRMPTRQWITADHWRQFRADGYMVIRDVVPGRLATGAASDIAAFVGADLSDRGTWYGGAPELDGLVPLHHAQSQWDIRQFPAVHDVFTEFFGTPRLMVDINRCIFRPPVHRRWPTVSHGTIHWDTDPRAPGPGSLQSIILLSDVRCNGGGFQCLPQIFQNLDQWLEQNAGADDFDFFRPGLDDCETVQVEGNAGDVILWSTRLPHGSAINLSDRPRMAMGIAIQPPADDPQLRDAMKTWWLTKRAPDHWRSLPGQLDPEPGAPATLSELGLKLIGAVPWPSDD